MGFVNTDYRSFWIVAALTCTTMSRYTCGSSGQGEAAGTTHQLSTMQQKDHNKQYKLFLWEVDKKWIAVSHLIIVYQIAKLVYTFH